ncbi:Hepatoma-derived growth factor [Frankliniella fusca]|uniref:Hepatoma-derived growth factor n=1 Tax=Frankliniella fusca TaxID=407009 RepID=A0AAE1LPL5_9NEOP|nr:Hepatoma-derived growth factor [Frankliniella fusca]
MALKYKSGDKVFAKVRGYPYWPARIEACADETPNKMKYHVYFYGTAETAICKAEEVIPYAPNKDKYGKPLKRKGFNEGLQQIEMEINGFAPSYPTYTDTAPDTDEPENEGSLVIDENLSANNPTAVLPEKKKKLTTVLKRKRESLDSVSEDYASKSKQARMSAGTPVGSTPSGRSSVDGDSPTNKVKAVSRSGRKIKPKKFADDEDGTYDTYENGSVSLTGIPTEKQDVSAISPVTLASSPDPTANRARKLQGTVRQSNPPTQNSPDESAKTPSDTQGGIPSDNPGRAIMAKALSGHWVQIRLDDERPASFEASQFSNTSEEARRLWDAATARNAERLRTQIELGEYLPDTIKKQLEGKAELTDAQKKEWLKQEAHLLELDAHIRSSLSLANADARRCLKLMDEMLIVNIDPLMLKKHPNIVETVKKLQRYIGNTSKWGLSEEETEKFNASCDQIRLKANHMYHKFKKLFAVPNNTSFWEIFHQEVERFNEAVKHLPRDQVYALVVDPEKLNNLDESEDDDKDDSSSKEKAHKSPRGKKTSVHVESSIKRDESADTAT